MRALPNLTAPSPPRLRPDPFARAADCGLSSGEGLATIAAMNVRRFAAWLSLLAMVQPGLRGQEPVPPSTPPTKWKSPTGEMLVVHAPPADGKVPRWTVWWTPLDAKQAGEMLFHFDELQRRHGDRGVRIAMILAPDEAKVLAAKKPNVAVVTPVPLTDDELPEGPQDHVFAVGWSAYLATAAGELLADVPMDALDDALLACASGGELGALAGQMQELEGYLHNVTDAEVPEATAQGIRKALPHCGGAHACAVLEAWWGRGDHAAALAAVDQGLRELGGQTYATVVFCDFVLRGDHSDPAVPRRLAVELAPVVAASGDSPFAQLVYVRALLRAGNQKLAGRIVEKLQKTIGQRADLQLQLAETLMDAPEPKGFRALAEQLLAASEQNGHDEEAAMMTRHKILVRCGDAAGAKKLFEARFPDRDSSILNNVAWYCCIRPSTLGRFPTFADEVANAMMEHSGGNILSNYRDTVALAFFCAGRVDEAVEQQRTALAEHRGDHRFEGRMRRYEDAQRRRQQTPPPAPKPADK